MSQEPRKRGGITGIPPSSSIYPTFFRALWSSEASGFFCISNMIVDDTTAYPLCRCLRSRNPNATGFHSLFSYLPAGAAISKFTSGASVALSTSSPSSKDGVKINKKLRTLLIGSRLRGIETCHTLPTTSHLRKRYVAQNTGHFLCVCDFQW